MRVLLFIMCAAAILIGQSDPPKKNKTRSQTIHPGDPPTNAPGGTQKHDSKKTGTQNPWGQTQPPAPTPSPLPPGPGGSSTGGTCPGNGAAAPAPGPYGSVTSIQRSTVTYDSIGFGLLGYRASALGDALRIEGDQQFVAAVTAHLNTISQCASGQALLDQIQGVAAHGTRITYTANASATKPLDQPRGSFPYFQSGGLVADYVAATDAAAPGVYYEERGQIVVFDNIPPFIAQKRGQGANALIRIDPYATFNQRPSDLQVYHELCHALRMMNGKTNYSPRNDSFESEEEWAVIGDPLNPPAPSENAYRQERGLPVRTGHQRQYY
jgi:Effector protein